MAAEAPQLGAELEMEKAKDIANTIMTAIRAGNDIPSELFPALVREPALHKEVLSTLEELKKAPIKSCKEHDQVSNPFI